MADLQTWDWFDHSSQVMKTLLSDIDIDLKPRENALLESLSILRRELTMLLKVYPIGSIGLWTTCNNLQSRNL